MVLGYPPALGARRCGPIPHHRLLATLPGVDSQPVQLWGVGPSRPHLEVWTSGCAGDVVAVRAERTAPRFGCRSAGTQSTGTTDRSQTSNRRRGQTAGGAAASTLVGGGNEQRFVHFPDSIRNEELRLRQLTAELGLDSLRVASWSTTPQGSLWTSQSLAGVGLHDRALAAATNDDLVGVPAGRTRMVDSPVAAIGVTEKSKNSTPPRHLARNWAASPPHPFAQRSAYPKLRPSSVHSEGKNGYNNTPASLALGFGIDHLRLINAS
jgi:hypothetical protein